MKPNLTYLQVSSGPLHVPVTQRDPVRQDLVLRVLTNANATIEVVGAASTPDFMNAVRNAVGAQIFPLHLACEALGSVIDRMKDREEYNNHYREFLLGNLSEEDFEQISERVAYTPSTANVRELAEKIKALLRYTKHEFTKDEVAELFQVREEDVDSAITSQMPLFGA